MSAVNYAQAARLSDGHAKGITCVSFNRDGSLLATAGLDGTVCLWATATWSLVDVYYAKTPVTSLAWFSDNALVCGLQDGNLSSLVKIAGVSVNVSGFSAHHYPVEHLSVREAFVASAAHSEISVWSWDTNALSACLYKRVTPPSTDQDCEPAASSEANLGDEAEGKQREKMSEVLATGISWAPSFLIVTYLHHGIRFYDTDSWKNVRVIDTKGPIVRSSLSPNGARLAVSDLSAGFEVYDLETEEVVRAVKYEGGDQERAIPVAFIHGGHAIVCGSTVGKVNVWFVDSGIGLDALHIPGDGKVLALAGYYDRSADRFLIATGVMNEDSASSTIIWVAQMPVLRTEDERTHDNIRMDRGSAFTLHVGVVLAAVVSALVALGLAFAIKEGLLEIESEFALYY